VATRLLGAHVSRRTENRAVARLARIEMRAVGTSRSRQAEIEHLHRAVRGDLDVRRLQVAVDDALLVGGVERVRDLPRDGERSGDWEAP
jgi:hypothetical protein